jgi:hypothetical protein
MSLEERIKHWVIPDEQISSALPLLDTFLESLGALRGSSRMRQVLAHAEKRIEQIFELLER